MDRSKSVVPHRYDRLSRNIVALLIAASLCVAGGACSHNDGDGLKVNKRVVSTDIFALAGSKVDVEASGTVDFGGAVGGIGAPKLDADGDNEPTPIGYPAQGLRKNSLICKVGSLWYQCGVRATFWPTEDGVILLAPNDGLMTDNSRGWRVKVSVTPPTTSAEPADPQPEPTEPSKPAPKTYGTVGIARQTLRTELPVEAGSTVRIVAGGLVDVGGAPIGPKVSADGEGDAPGDYPAPDLTKNSLIVGIGERWYQGGVNTTIVPTTSGELVMRPNDAHMSDNSRGWVVRVTIAPPGVDINAEERQPIYERKAGPLGVLNLSEDTALSVRAGSLILVEADKSINFGGAPWPIPDPVLSADGDSEVPPTSYPSPSLRKNSLIVRIGNIDYQGGVRERVVPFRNGKVELLPNDGEPTDNEGGWDVFVSVDLP